jgi:outer membrane protein assembly factor BamB
MQRTIVYILAFSIISVSSIFAQSQRFAWLSDLRIGAPGSEDVLSAAVAKLNTAENLSCVIITGSCTEHGKTTELQRAKELLDVLTVKYYIVPGIQDSRWSESFGTAFRQIFGDDRFNLELKNCKLLGLNSAPLWCSGRGHFRPEDISWLDSVVMNSPSKQKLLFVSNQSLNGEVDNWYAASSILSRGNIRCLFSSDPSKAQIKNSNEIPSLSCPPLFRKDMPASYALVTIGKDTLSCAQISGDDTIQNWAAFSLHEQLKPRQIDTTEIDNYATDFNWVKELNRTTIAMPVFSNEKIYLATSAGEIWCYNAKGDVVWKAQTHAPVSGRLAVDQGVVVAATLDGDIITYDGENGRVIQSIGTDDKLTSTPVIFKTTYRNDETFAVLVGTSTGKLLCFELSSLNLIWENNSASGLIQSLPVLVKDRILFGSWDGYLYCIDAMTGTMNWKWNEAKNQIYAPAACVPQVADGAVFVVTPDRFVSKIDLLLGKTVWRKKEFDGWESIGMSADKKRLFIKSAVNKFFVVNAADGKKIHEYDLKSGYDLAPVEPRETPKGVLIGTGNGFVWLLTPTDQKKLFYMGGARITGILQTGENSFVASNIDGRIIFFAVQEDK